VDRGGEEAGSGDVGDVLPRRRPGRIGAGRCWDGGESSHSGVER
jgi:hypothetical protein